MTTTHLNAIKWGAAAVVLLALGAAGGYWWAHRMMLSDGAMATSVDGSGTGNANTPSGKRKILYWHDPMVPGQKFDKPGKSPFMDMPLVPVYADEAGEGGEVRVNANIVQNLGIRLGKVEKVSLSTRLRAVGNVAFDEGRLELVQSRVEGYVTRLHAKAPLVRVRRGQPLAEILAPQWLEAEQEYLAILDASSPRAQTLRDAARQRLVVLGVPEPTIRAVEISRKASVSTTVWAPIDGVVTELGVREGASFMSGASLFQINGLKTVWVNAQIPEANVSSVPVGERVEATATAWPGTTFNGEVIALLPQVDPMTRTLVARIALENPDDKLSPGMFVTLNFTSPQSEPQLVVPSEALIATGERTVVIAAREDGGFDVVNVTTGAEEEGRTAILSGLTEGQSIVLSGQFLIDSEASLKSTVDRLTSAPSSSSGAEAQGKNDAPQTLHQTRGIVKAISPTEITIAHEPVSSLEWGAMTMAFTLPTKGLPKGIRVGQHVEFSFFATKAGGYQINSINPVDRPAQDMRP